MIEFDWVEIPAGNFVMGCQHPEDTQVDDQATPRRLISLRDYKMQRNLFTEGQWAEYRKLAHEETVSPIRPNSPKVNVSWLECVALAGWLREYTGRAYALPTEAQWERACRGTDARQVSWGGTFDPVVFFDQFDPQGLPDVGHAPQLATPTGIEDMCTHAQEWCLDWFGEYKCSERPIVEPAGPPVGRYKVARGGHWAMQQYCCFARGFWEPTESNQKLGFRLVLNPN